MWESLGNFFTQNKDLIGGMGSLAGGLGSAYGAISQGKMANKNYKLQLRAWQDEKKRREMMDSSLDSGFKNSLFGANALSR